MKVAADDDDEESDDGDDILTQLGISRQEDPSPPQPEPVQSIEQPPQPTTPNSSADTQSTGIEGCPVTTEPSLSVSAADDASSPDSNQPQLKCDTEDSLARLSNGKFSHLLSSLYA